MLSQFDFHFLEINIQLNFHYINKYYYFMIGVLLITFNNKMIFSDICT